MSRPSTNTNPCRASGSTSVMIDIASASVRLQTRDPLLDQRNVLRLRDGRRVRLQRLQRLRGLALLVVRAPKPAVAGDVTRIDRERLLVRADCTVGVAGEQPL